MELQDCDASQHSQVLSGLWFALTASSRPTVAQNARPGVMVLSHLVQLVAAEQMHVQVICPQEESHMAFPSCGIVT